MTVERALRLIAGTFVVLSILLGMYVSTGFFWFTLFVGLNLFQSAFTNWCLMMVVLRKIGLRDGGQRFFSAHCPLNEKTRYLGGARPGAHPGEILD
jgi:hypothetical protein